MFARDLAAGAHRAVKRTRQRHAIEHATIHLLSARFPRVVVAGLSDPWAFNLYGRLPREAIELAVGEALLRLQAGEKEIAIHPNCGTSFLTSVLLATGAALVGAAGNRRSLVERTAVAAGLIAFALLLATSLGLRFQRLTTSGSVGALGLVKVEPQGGDALFSGLRRSSDGQFERNVARTTHRVSFIRTGRRFRGPPLRHRRLVTCF